MFGVLEAHNSGGSAGSGGGGSGRSTFRVRTGAKDGRCRLQLAYTAPEYVPVRRQGVSALAELSSLQKSRRSSSASVLQQYRGGSKSLSTTPVRELISMGGPRGGGAAAVARALVDTSPEPKVLKRRAPPPPPPPPPAPIRILPQVSIGSLSQAMVNLQQPGTHNAGLVFVSQANRLETLQAAAASFQQQAAAFQQYPLISTANLQHVSQTLLAAANFNQQQQQMQQQQLQAAGAPTPAKVPRTNQQPQ